MHGLINQLLSLARSDAGGSRLELVSIDVTALVREVVSEAMMLATEKGLSVSTELPEQPLQAAIDEASFRRVLLILLDNAIKYTPGSGRITVSAIEDEEGVAIAIADTGPGIPADDLPFIFDRFWRADKVRSRDAGGTGLGLAIAREIARSSWSRTHRRKLAWARINVHGSTSAFCRRPRRKPRVNCRLADGDGGERTFQNDLRFVRDAA